MFAFLLYDHERRLVVAARDHFGIKPLYLHAGPGQLLFASEIKALLRHPAVRAEPDFDSMKDYLTFQYVLGEGTLFKGIRKRRMPRSSSLASISTPRSTSPSSSTRCSRTPCGCRCAATSRSAPT